MPANVSEKEDSFLLDKQTVIVATSESDKKTAELFNAWLKELTGYELAVKDQGNENAILLHTGNDTTNGEGYTLNVDHNNITINGNSGSGTFYGVQTLIQGSTTVLAVTNLADIKNNGVLAITNAGFTGTMLIEAGGQLQLNTGGNLQLYNSAITNFGAVAWISGSLSVGGNNSQSTFITNAGFVADNRQ